MATPNQVVYGTPECGDTTCTVCDVNMVDVSTMDASLTMEEVGGNLSRAMRSMSEATEVKDTYARREMIPNDAVVTIDREEAEKQLGLYDGLELTEREKNLLEIYDAVAAGEKIIQLETVLKRGGAMNDRGFPKLALAPVTQEKVKFERILRGPTRAIQVHAHYEAGKKWKYWLPLWRENSQASSASAEALTPLVPPPHRDKVEDGDLFLWEATWLKQKESRIQYDPAVIRPLSNGLYKVVAAWDLTPVEAMALGSE